MIMALSLAVAMSASAQTAISRIDSQTTISGAVTTHTIDTDASSSSLVGTPALIDHVTQTAHSFQDTYKEVQVLINQSLHSREAGTAALDKMLQLLHSVQESLSDQGPIWQECEALKTKWKKSQTDTLNRSVQDPQFLINAEKWNKKVEDLSAMEADIRRQRNEILANIDRVNEQREFILDQYDLDDAQAALDGLKKMDSQLNSINTDLNAMINQAKQVSHAGA